MITPQLQDEVAAGQAVPLTILARKVPSYRSGRPATLSRLLRWVLTGVKGPGGERLRLEAMRSPSGWLSTPAALARFFAALTPEPGDATPRVPTRRGRPPKKSAAEKAGEALAKIGI